MDRRRLFLAPLSPESQKVRKVNFIEALIGGATEGEAAWSTGTKLMHLRRWAEDDLEFEKAWRIVPLQSQ